MKQCDIMTSASCWCCWCSSNRKDEEDATSNTSTGRTFMFDAAVVCRLSVLRLMD